MNTNSSPEPKPTSEARLRANRENAKLSSGPTPAGTLRTRFNALKHGLSAASGWAQLDTPKNRECFRLAYVRLGPRNAFEATCVNNLLLARLQEDVFLEIERGVLTRRPVSLARRDERPYPFLDEPAALKTVQQFGRHLAHRSRAAETELLALLQARKDPWGNWSKNASSASPVDAFSAAAPLAEGPALPEGHPDAGAPAVYPGTLEYCLADTRVILPGEDEQDYLALARELWATFRPVNTLEGFVVSDFIQSQWRLERVVHIEAVLFERSAVSASGDNCGAGFAFVQDSQGNQASESLHQYEAVLRKRLKRRMALLRKLRKQGWEDAILPILPAPTEHTVL